MLRILLALFCFALPAWAGPADPFDTGRLTREDARFLQAALAFGGTYVGRIDGDWGAYSDRALDAAAGPSPRELDVLSTLGPFLDDFDAAGWRAFDPPNGTALLLPQAILISDEGPDYVSFRTPDRSLVIRYIFRDGRGSGEMHDWLRANHIGTEAFYRADTPEAYVSRGRVAAGRVYLRTRDLGQIFETVLVQWDPDQAARARVVVASLSNGAVGPLVLPDYGYFAGMLSGLAAPGEATAGASSGPRATARGSGTAFHIGNADLLTAWHVVENCGRVTFEDGTPIKVLAHDAVLDTALLTSAARSGRWVDLEADTGARLGQEVFALGFPYSRQERDGVVATGGNLSALASNGDRPRHMISAPVQPGNSGGPVLARSGRVIGLVTARLDDIHFLEETGTIPQNVNFATPIRPILSFLKRNGVVLPPSRERPPALADGIPSDVEASVRRILCWGRAGEPRGPWADRK